MKKREQPKFPIGTEELLSTMARLAATRGDTFAVAILASSEAAKIFAKWYDPPTQTRQTNDLFETMFGLQPRRAGWYFSLTIQIPYWVYNRVDDVDDDRNFFGEFTWEANLKQYANTVLKSYQTSISEIVLGPSPTSDKDWRDKAWNWITGEKLTNQGRVRSDNIASRTKDGLLFRSESEILLYQALKACGVSFAPLPVFIRGGETYKRIEPDFVILKDGIVLIVEVDGDTFHRETPAEAHARTTMLAHEGARVERVKAIECNTPSKAKTVAARLISVIEKLKKSQ